MQLKITHREIGIKLRISITKTRVHIKSDAKTLETELHVRIGVNFFWGRKPKKSFICLSGEIKSY